MGGNCKWTDQQNALIHKHYKYNIEHLFTLKLFVNRTRMAVIVQANRLGLHRRPWMLEEDEIIIKCYKDYGALYCMRYLKGRTEIAISSRAINLKVKRDLRKRKNKLPEGNVMETEELAFNKPWGSKS